MPHRSALFSALLIVATIAAGLALRLLHLGLPLLVVKYGGSFLWGLLIYWIVSALRPRWPVTTCAVGAMIVSTSVEVFKLVHAPGSTPSA